MANVTLHDWLGETDLVFSWRFCITGLDIVLSLILWRVVLNGECYIWFSADIITHK
jgi:hypothetical protein